MIEEAGPTTEAQPVSAPLPEQRRKIAIVGEIPFAGSALIPELLAAGMSARVLCPNSAAIEAVKSAAGAAPEHVEAFSGDVDSLRCLDEALAGAYGLIFVSPISPLRGRTCRPQTHLADLRNVLETAQKIGVRKVLYHSALGADANSSASCLRDAAAAEALVQACRCEDYCVRTGPLMGHRDGFLTEIAASAAAAAPTLGVLGYGGTLLQPLHVGDLARCLVRFFETEKELQPGTYHLAGPEITTYLDLMDQALERLGRVKLKFHAPLFVLRLLTSLNKGGAFEERVNLLSALYCTDQNDAKKLVDSERSLITPRQAQEEILAGA